MSYLKHSKEKGEPWLVGASSYKLKGCRLNSWSGHRPGLHVLSLVRVHAKDPISVSLPFFLPSHPYPPTTKKIHFEKGGGK